MNNILPFRQRPVTGTQPALKDRARYHCKICDGQHFLLLDDFSVACASCHGHMSNLRISDVNKGGAA